jgi:hypothetical protein
LAAEPPTAGLGGGDAGLDALADEIALELGERRHHDPYVCEMQLIKDPSAQFHGGRRSP